MEMEKMTDFNLNKSTGARRLGEGRRFRQLPGST